MTMMLSLILVLGLTALAHCRVPTLPGTCPDFKPFGSLDSQKLAGDWFLHFNGRIGDGEANPLVKRCGKKSVTAKPDGNFEEVLTYVDSDGKIQTENALVTKVEGSDGNYLISGLDGKDIKITGTLLDTDNVNFLIAVLCYTDGNKHGIHVVVYGREKTFGAAYLDKSKEALKSRNLDVELSAEDQNC